ncbi:response regulator transcription factor [Pareuzebyella sediminis]|uniref:response regulator transcription factor n=1 Tax=Pareuzebyella sediminis TaxID=2607998 RepID=UPI001E5356E9|nr:helix-turn-helix transcriptional regulator [Pareuzebyella sediminis]
MGNYLTPMNLVEIEKGLKPFASYERNMTSKVSDILEKCERSENLMIGIYLIEHDHFLYVNQNLKKMLGEGAGRLLQEGWPFWLSRIDPEENGWIEDRIVNFWSSPLNNNPLSMRYHITCLKKKRVTIKHEIIVHRLNGLNLAINYFFDVTDIERIEGCFSVGKDANPNICSKNRCTTISSREREVLHLVADGFSSKQIADMLFISNHTAISHRKNLIEKFGVKNTAQLIKTASKVMDL